MQTDFLVIGSGIAGLTFALKTANHFPNKKIMVITKTQSDETNTKYAQGGIAGVMNFDTDKWETAPTIKTWMTDIREGRREDKYGWMVKVD